MRTSDVRMNRRQWFRAASGLILPAFLPERTYSFLWAKPEPLLYFRGPFDWVGADGLPLFSGVCVIPAGRQFSNVIARAGSYMDVLTKMEELIRVSKLDQSWPAMQPVYPSSLELP